MSMNKVKPISEEFRAGGQKYRAEEWQSHRGVTITAVVSNEKAWDVWPVGAYEKYGSKLLLQLSILLFQNGSDGMSRLRELNAHEPNEA